MEAEPDDVVTSIPDLSGVCLADVPAPLVEVLERLTAGGELVSVSAFSSSI